MCSWSLYPANSSLNIKYMERQGSFLSNKTQTSSIHAVARGQVPLSVTLIIKTTT